MPRKAAPTIHRVVRYAGAATFSPGDEEALQAFLTPEAYERLTAIGAISGFEPPAPKADAPPATRTPKGKAAKAKAGSAGDAQPRPQA